LPGLGSGQGRAQNLPQSPENRASSLQSRMSSGDRQNMGQRQQQRQNASSQNQQQRQNAGSQNQQNRQDNRSQNREDWQNWAGDYHGDWYHGAWAGGSYAGGWGNMWSNYPAAAAMGVTWWGASRMANAFGMGSYNNPYYGAGGGGGGGYDYSQPLVTYQQQTAEQQTAAAQPAAAPATPEAPEAALPPGVNQAGLDLFDQARAAFSSGDYKQALDLCNQAIQQMPNDAVLHEFRSLSLFALKNYRESAAAAYAVLSAGPGWDWTTLSGLYGNIADYTAQLRALEAFVKKNAKSSDGHFLLAYHYLTAGHTEDAQIQLREVNKLTPNDRLVRQLLGLSASGDDQQPSTEPKPPPDADSLLLAEQLVGVWTAGGSGGAKYQMTLNNDSSFAWKFTSGKKSDEIKGAFAVDQNNLALEVDDGSVMLADVALSGNQLKFKVIGGDETDKPLIFSKGK
jgi:tetratricopeptide (TPR) repeat protein